MPPGLSWVLLVPQHLPSPSPCPSPCLFSFFIYLPSSEKNEAHNSRNQFSVRRCGLGLAGTGPAGPGLPCLVSLPF